MKPRAERNEAKVSEQFQTESCTLSFGRYLRAIREQQEIPLQAVADEIRISRSQLARIEAEDHAHLPDEVYLKGILRAYAKYIGVDADDIIERYAINRATYQKALHAKTEESKSRKKVFSRIMMATGGLLTLIVLALAVVYFSSSGLPPIGLSSNTGKASKHLQRPTGKTGITAGTTKKDAGSHSEAMRTVKPEPSMTAQTSESGKTISVLPDMAGKTSTTLPSDKLVLAIDAVSATTVTVQIDGLEYKKYHLQANDHIELEAAARFNLLISDASGVKLTLNGRSVAIHGEPGHSVNIVLPGK